MILFGAKSALVAAFFLFSAQNVLAHMSLADPFPFNSPKNPNTKNADFNLNAPLSGSGNNFPCKGAHKLLGTPEGKPVASWSSGSSQSFTYVPRYHTL